MAKLSAAWEAFQRINGVGAGLGEFAAGPESTTALGRAIQGTVKAQCQGYSRSPAWIRALDPSTYLVYDSMCRPLANRDGYDLPVIGNTQSGGQCEGVVYNISYEVRNKVSTRFACGEFTDWRTVTSVIGNGGVIVGPVGNLETRFTVASTDPNASEPDRVQYILPTGTGVVFLNLGGVAGRTFFRPCGVSYEVRNIQLTRADGLPDDCGDFPPEPITPPNPAPPADIPPEFRPRTGPQSDPFGDIPLLPFVDPELGPVTPQEGGDPPLVVPPNGARPGSSDGVGDPIDGSGAGGGAGPDGGEDVPFGPPPEGRVWVGALIEATAPPALGNIAGSGPGNTAYPRVVGNCSLTYSGGRGRAQRIESKWTDLGRPTDALQVVGCRVNVLPGVSFRVYPVSDETCPKSTCE